MRTTPDHTLNIRMPEHARRAAALAECCRALECQVLRVAALLGDDVELECEVPGQRFGQGDQDLVGVEALSICAPSFVATLTDSLSSRTDGVPLPAGAPAAVSAKISRRSTLVMGLGTPTSARPPIAETISTSDQFPGPVQVHRLWPRRRRLLVATRNFAR